MVRQPQYLLKRIKKNTKTITGRNLRHISLELNNINVINAGPDYVKKNVKYSYIENEEILRNVNMIRELTDIKQNKVKLVFGDGMALSRDELNQMINNISVA